MIKRVIKYINTFIMKPSIIIACVITGLIGLAVAALLLFGTLFLDAPGSGKYAPYLIAGAITAIIIATAWIIISIKIGSLYFAFAPLVIVAVIGIVSSFRDNSARSKIFSKLGKYNQDFVCSTPALLYDYIFIDTEHKQAIAVKKYSSSFDLYPVGKIDGNALYSYQTEDAFPEYFNSCKNAQGNRIADIYKIDFTSSYVTKKQTIEDYNLDQYR